MLDELERVLRVTNLTHDTTPEQVSQETADLYRDMLSFEENWARHYAEIQALPQLFIAV